ncbi:hypothetical protein F5Y10DRAFT_267428 [Nemania abortiva]|nr:hypothetical protein F5Y10DRAFT_267428 [Nemania abortiva]
MASFESTLITAIVASIVSVLAFLALTLVIALYWTSVALIARFSLDRLGHAVFTDVLARALTEVI